MKIKNYHKKLRSRSRKGAALALVALLALLVVIAIVFGFKAMVFMGGSQELKNSVDAGALNVAKRAIQTKINPGEYGYSDVADSTGKVGLANMNRVWAKALLINANQQEMQTRGTSASGSNMDADIAYKNATMLNNRLFGALNRQDFADLNFQQMAQGKPAKLLGNEGTVVESGTGAYATACVYRGEESNITHNDLQTIPPNSITPHVITINNNNFLQGYNGMTANSRTFCFTTFHSEEAPHLISNKTFDQWHKVAVPGTDQSVLPNTFRSGGELNGKVQLAATACAVANPMRTYQLTIPHSYIRISYENQAYFFVQGGLVGTYPYDAFTGKLWGAKSIKLQPPAKGVLNGYAMLGQEYNERTLSQAIEALPGDHSAVYNALLQRVKEFKPGYSMSELKALITSQQILPEKSSYIIFPTYNTQDNTDPTVHIAAQGSTPSWLQINEADGSEKVLVSEAAVANAPNTCTSNIIGPYPTDKHSTSETGSLYWKPGTGYNQCLGQLRIHRDTSVTFTGMP